jgi:hypothetical protein
MKKTKTKTKVTTKISTVTREKLYYRSLDMRQLWEEFAFKVKRNGTRSYPTIWSFIKAKTKHTWQRDFLYWVLGPEATEGKSPYPGYTQLDFESKREKGFWHSSKNIENVAAEIRRKDTSFAKLQAAGMTLLEDLGELGELNKQVSREFGGRLLLDENTAEENAARISLFLEVKSRIQILKAGVLSTFAKTQGMDMNQLANFLELFAGGMGQAASAQLGYGGGNVLTDGKTEKLGYENVLKQLCDMTMNKAAELEMELPDDGKTIIEDLVEKPKPNGHTNGKGRSLQ